MRRRLVGIAAAAIAVTALIAVVDMVVTIGSIDRVADDPDAARIALGLPSRTSNGEPFQTMDPPSEEPGSAVPAATAPAVTTYLVVGSDTRPGLGGARADVLMLGLLPEPAAGRPALVSLPRDLWVDDLCHGGRQRVNAALNGCRQGITGAQLLSLTVEHVTGLPVDHYLEIDLGGFENLVEALGGVEVCTATPVRDVPAGLELPGGCLEPSGAQTLAWVRARHLEERVDGRWRPVPGVSDLTRNDHQQQVLLQVAASLIENRSPLRMRDDVESLLEVVTLGERLSVDRLVTDAWAWRHADSESVHRPVIPVIAHTTSNGAQVLLSTSDLHEWFRGLVTDLHAPRPS